MINNLELWQHYKKHKDEKSYRKLIEEYLGLVKIQVNRIYMTLPAHIEKEDLESYGIIGLLDAIEKFSPERGIKFDTYARKRIRGEIMDQLRRLDWLPYSLRQKAKLIKKTAEEMRNKLGYKPSLEEVAEKINIPVEEIRNINNKLQETECVSLYAQIGERRIFDFLPDIEEKRPENIFQKQERLNILTENINKLTEEEKLVITLYYYEELTQIEIAEVMNLSPARISQIHKKAIFRMRGFLAKEKKQLV